MPSDATEFVVADLFLLPSDSTGPALVARKRWRRMDITLESMRALARDEWGVDAFVLHDGGLQAGIAEAAVLLEGHGRVVRGSVASAVAPGPRNARAWQRSGWYADVLLWLEARLAAIGEVLAGEVEQVSTYDLGCVLRASSSQGAVYLKAGETAREALVTQQLARLRPGWLPEVLAVDEKRSLMLTRDAGVHLAEIADLHPWQAAVTRLAQVHRGMAAVELAGLETPDYEFDSLPGRARGLLFDRAALRGWGLPGAVVAQLGAVAPRLEAAHRRVSSLGLSSTLTHGDVHPMNVLVGPKGVALFDWHEAGRAHPFLDAGWFFGWLSHPARTGLPVRVSHPDVVDVLWREYLSALGVEGDERLLEDAMVIALAHRAVTFHQRFGRWQGTVPGWRPQYVPYYLKWFWNLCA